MTSLKDSTQHFTASWVDELFLEKMKDHPAIQRYGSAEYERLMNVAKKLYAEQSGAYKVPPPSHKIALALERTAGKPPRKKRTVLLEILRLSFR
jgi:hypothetical protein